MQDTIFTVELPFVETNEKLEKIKAMYPKYDPYFITSGCCKKRKEKFDKLYEEFKPYADKHFLTEVKTNFHQRSWEMYVGNVLLSKKIIIQSKNEGPDFVIDKVAYIECVAPTKGDPTKSDSVPEILVATKPEEICVQDVPVDKMILRITQTIKDKALGQYENWKSKKWFDSKIPFLIAVNTVDLEYPQDYLGIPLIIKALFGLQFLQIDQDGNKSFSWINEIKKQSGYSVPVNYFTNCDYNFVSGIIFSDKTVLNHPDNIGDDCIFVNNPFAKNPIKNNFISLFKNWKAEIKGILQKNYS